MTDERRQEADFALKQATLHRHWIAADSINHHLRRSMRWEEPHADLPAEFEALALQASLFAALSVWYGLLYVVIEGYREIGYRDEAIDTLLADQEMTDAFRRFRNGTFQFQRDPIPAKLVEFITRAESEIWVRNLNAAFRRFFEERGKIREWIEALTLAPDD